MVSKSCLSMLTVPMLMMAAALGFVLVPGNSEPSLSEETTAVTPTDCPPIEVEVVASVARKVKVGETFVLNSSSSGFAGLAQTRLYVEYRLAFVPDLNVSDPSPTIEVLPGSTGSSLGSGEFVLRALEPGTIRLYTEVYGDAYFYSTGCHRGTTFKLVRSESVTVEIEP